MRRWATRGLLLIALVFLLKEASAIVLPVLVALILTFVLAPAVRTMRHHGLPESVSAAMLVTTLVGCTVLSVALLAEPVAQWWQRAPVAVSQALNQVDKWRAAIPGFGPPVERRSSNRAAPTPPTDPVRERIASEGVALTAQALGIGLKFLVSTAATTILLYFLLASEHWVLSRCIELLPHRPRLRAMVLGGLRAAQRDISRYVASVSVINIGVGLVVSGTMWFVDLPNPGFWGALAAIFNFIPYLGPLIMCGLLLAASLAASLGDAGFAALAAPVLSYLCIHAIESNFVTPMVIGKRLSMNPLSVLLSVMFWGWLWGVAGAVLAVPLLICLRSISQRNRQMRPVAVYLRGSDRPCTPLSTLLRPPRPPHLSQPVAPNAPVAFNVPNVPNMPNVPSVSPPLADGAAALAHPNALEQHRP
jgi:predicted PurR-regulated permease PerM